jgi:hypothetical protein
MKLFLILIFLTVLGGTFADSTYAIKQIYLLHKNKEKLLQKKTGLKIKNNIHQFLLKQRSYVDKKNIITYEDSKRKVQLTSQACGEKAKAYVWIQLPLNIPVKGKIYYDYCVSL